MTRHLFRGLSALVLAVTAIGAASSCSTPPTGSGGSRPAAVPQPAMAAPTSVGRSIAQLDHGRRAHFASCTPPACPVVTPKTLAVDPQAAAAAATPLRSDTGPASDAALGTSPSPGETFVDTARQASGPRAQRPSIGAASTPEPLVTEVTVTFRFGSAVLDAAARAAIDVAAAEDGVRRLDIRGRTDTVGPALANEVLARRRAASVAQYLRARHPHLANASVHVDARGSCCYAVANDSAAGRARNRRVEIAFERDPTDL